MKFMGIILCVVGCLIFVNAVSGSGSQPNVGTSDWSSGISTDQKWDRAISGGDWSSKVNSNYDTLGSGGVGSGYGSDSHNEANVKYVIIEKAPDRFADESESRVLPAPFMGGRGAPMPGPMSRPMSLPSLPFSSAGHRMSTGLLPGSYSSRTNTEFSMSSIIYVPLISPGVPKYCVRCPILNCPGICERVNDHGCHSCPCAPSRFQTMPIDRGCSRRHEESCTALELCKSTCKDGFHVGDRDSSGCQTCSCIRYAPRTTPKPTGKECPGTLSCMLKCKDGYILGDNMGNGCPSCRCLPKSSSENHSSGNSSHNYGNSYHNNNNYNSNSGNNGNGYYGNSNHNNNYNSNTGNSGNGNYGNSNYGNTNSGFNNGGSSSGGGDVYSGVSNGMGDGQCKPPMCLNGHMSVGEAMTIGESSAGSGVSNGGSYNGMTSSGGSSKDSGTCYPMCAGGSGGGMTLGRSGSDGGGKTSGGMGGSSGCSGPFCASMGGGMGGVMGGGGGMNGRGEASGGKPFSPFAAAMSGMHPGMGMSGGGGAMGMGMGGMDKMPGSQSSVEKAAYNKDCIGAECSAKNGMHADRSSRVKNKKRKEKKEAISGKEEILHFVDYCQPISIKHMCRDDQYWKVRSKMFKERKTIQLNVKKRTKAYICKHS